MSKKPKAVARPLDVITREIGVALQCETTNIIKLGNLLIEAKAQVDWGAWLKWLENNFDLTDRTARNYMKAAEYAAQIGNGVSDLNVSPVVLYALAAGSYDPEVTASILKLAKKRRVDQNLAATMVLAKTLKKDEGPDDGLSKNERRLLEQEKLRKEAEAILDNPPPDVPPAPEPVPLETDTLR
jgi:hypothetical protein